VPEASAVEVDGVIVPWSTRRPAACIPADALLVAGDDRGRTVARRLAEVVDALEPDDGRRPGLLEDVGVEALQCEGP